MSDTKRFSTVSVLIPTRGRPARLKTMLDSYLETTSWLNSELVFRCDDDDPETFAYLKSRLLECPQRIIVGPRLGGYQSMPVFYNEMFAAATGDVLMCGNDDMVFKTPDWPTLLLNAANQYPDGVFDFGVDAPNETHYPFSVVSRIAAERLGFLWDPSIFWGDIYLRDVMGSLGRAMMLPSVTVDHEWAGRNPDRVFMESDKNITQRDPTYWEGTHARAVAAAVEKLRSLCAA